MRRIVMVWTAATLLLAPLVNAQPVGAKPSGAEIAKVLGSLYGIRPAFDKCIKALEKQGLVNASCENEELVFQDQRLNKDYTALMGKLDTAQKAKLRDVERIWLHYRDTYCVADFDSNGRPPLDEASCKMYETAKQADFLENRLSFL